MFESIINFFKKFAKNEQDSTNSKDTAKERLHLVLMQDRANVSADFLEMMKQEIIEVIKKYIEIDEKEIDVKLTNKTNQDGTIGAPALYANIPITNIKTDKNNDNVKAVNENNNKDEKIEEIKQDENNNKDEKIVEIKEDVNNNIKDVNKKQEINLEKKDKNKAENKKIKETKVNKEDENKKTDIEKTSNYVKPVTSNKKVDKKNK